LLDTASVNVRNRLLKAYKLCAENSQPLCQYLNLDSFVCKLSRQNGRVSDKKNVIAEHEKRTLEA
jgi:hypothetical protein